MSEATAVATVRKFNADELRSIESFDQLGALIKERGIDVVPVDKVLGDGFALSKDKDALVGRPFVILDYQFSTSRDTLNPETGEPNVFVSVRLMTEDNRKLIINDGSTGIRDQLRNLPDAVAGSVLYVPRGLRVSEYEVETVVKGKTVKQNAKTYYLSV